MWTRLRTGLHRKYGWPVFGIIDRYLSEEGKMAGQLHAHLWVVIPAGLSPDDILGRFGDDLRKRWSAIHQRATGVGLKGAPMALTPPKGGNPRTFSRYIAKSFNRGPNQARWGREKNETYHLMANVPTLWHRNDLPSRRKSADNVIRDLKAKYGRMIVSPLAA